MIQIFSSFKRFNKILNHWATWALLNLLMFSYIGILLIWG